MEERPLRQHLGEDAADGPDVDGRGVARGAEQHLGGAVPQGDDLGVRAAVRGQPHHRVTTWG